MAGILFCTNLSDKKYIIKLFKLFLVHYLILLLKQSIQWKTILNEIILIFNCIIIICSNNNVTKAIIFLI